MRYITAVILSLLMLAPLSLSAQNAASSPYSLYGLGELNDNVPNAFRAMGGVGIGMRSNRVINMYQPASYTAGDSLTFMFDVAADATWSNYSDARGTRNRANGNLDYITLQIPLWRQHIAMSLGAVPFSAAGYDIAMADSTAGYHFVKSFYGTGCISQIYGGISFNILDWVAVGGNFYYLFGSSSAFSKLAFVEAGTTPVDQAYSLRVHSFRYRLGTQVFHTFKDHRFVVGAIFESKMPLKSDCYYYEANSEFASDTIHNQYDIPLTFGVGGSYCYRNRLTVAFDYMHQSWSKCRAEGEQLRDRNRYALGVEYCANPYSRTYADRMMWRVGANVGNSYVMPVSGVEFTVSAGVGFPLHSVGTHVNLTAEYTRRRGAKANYPTDNALRFTINIAVAENWFFKRKI